jgi:hypothetical protein
MESLQSSKRETLVAFRIAAKDLEFFKQMAEDHYKRGDIKTPTVAALGKWNLYWTCNMLKDLEKARILTDQQRSENSHRAPEVEKPKIDDYKHTYSDHSYISSPMPPHEASQIPCPSGTTLQNQMIDRKEDYNINYDGKSITRPFFYEVFPDWEQLIPKTRTRTRTRTKRGQQTVLS